MEAVGKKRIDPLRLFIDSSIDWSNPWLMYSILTGFILFREVKGKQSPLEDAAADGMDAALARCVELVVKSSLRWWVGVTLRPRGSSCVLLTSSAPALLVSAVSGNQKTSFNLCVYQKLIYLKTSLSLTVVRKGEQCAKMIRRQCFAFSYVLVCLWYEERKEREGVRELVLPFRHS